MDINQQIEVVLQTSVILVSLITAIIMFLKAVMIDKAELKRKYYMGASFFFFIYSTSRIFFLLHRHIHGNLLYYYLGSMFGILSITCIVATIETVIYKKTKYFFTVLGAIGVLIDIYDLLFRTKLKLNMMVQTYLMPILAGFTILIYLSHIFKSTGMVRNHFILMTVGISLIGLGEMGNAISLYSYAAIVTFAGLMVIFIAIIKYYRDPKKNE